jgi:hypothetical protein
MLQPVKDPDPEVISDARRLAAAGADREMILVFLRDRKFNKIDSIKVVRGIYGLAMPEAKDLVDHSGAWSDRFQSDMQLRETAWKALREIADSQDPSLPKIIIDGDHEGLGSNESDN